MRVRERIWEIVEVARRGDIASRVFDTTILTLIFLNVIAVIAGSVQSIQSRYGPFLRVFNACSVIVFTVEYIARVWSCTIDPRFRKPLSGRLRFAVRPMPIIDLLAILPFYLPFLGVDLRSFRIIRLLRIFRIAKVGRYYASLNLIKYVLKEKKEELLLTTGLMAILLILSSSVLHFLESAVQPELFSSIPATMWWSVATLTTVGYGDMYPVTLMGKLFASITAILGIAMFALPTGILGAGFVEAIQERKKPNKACPHCGKTID